MKNFRYYLEHLLLLGIHAFCKIMPWRMASTLFGKLVATLFSPMARNRKAVRNVRAALHCSPDKAHEIAQKHWNNLGRVLAEFPHLRKIARNHVRFEGLEHIETLRDDGKAGILFGAHLGNWEVIPHALLRHADFAMHPVYRAPNNPYVDKRLHDYRSRGTRLVPYAKSRQGMTGMVKAVKNGEHLGLLIDQKYNEGIETEFFGMKARAGTAFIDMALKYNCPLVPIRCIREKDGFCIKVEPPLDIKNRDVPDILKEVHALLEKWIWEHPDQWLWSHRRWKLENLKYDER